MSGNHSRYSHQRHKRFVQSVLVQGAMVTDADQREAGTLLRRNTTTLGDTAIGTGVPKTGGILTYATTTGPADVVEVGGLRPGRVVADGHVGEVRLAEAMELTDIDGFDLLAKQADLLEGPALPEEGTFCLYADLFARHVGPAHDQRLVDAAFLSAETSVRIEQMAQLKFVRTEGDWTQDELRTAIETQLPAFGDLRLTSVEFVSEVIAPDECDPCATELTDVNLDAGNHLFRFEIHDARVNMPEFVDGEVRPASPADQIVVVKFSRDNGSVEVPASNASVLLSDALYDTAVFELVGPPGEQRLGLYSDGLTERASGLFGRADIEDQLGGTLDGMILRVWDGAVALDLSQNDLSPSPVGVQSAEGSITKSGGVWTLSVSLGGLALTFEAAERANGLPFIVPGDAYTIEIREYASASEDKLHWETLPTEVEHHYAFLGFVEDGAFDDGSDPDIRSRAFPALTELTAEDVAWSNHHHEDVEASTVQGAIDLLFDREVEGGGCLCTFCIDPERELGEQLEEILDNLREMGGAGALICIPAGIFVLEKPILFEGLVSVTLRGASVGATIIDVQSGSEIFAFTVLGTHEFVLEDLTIRCSELDIAGILSCPSVAVLRLWRTTLLLDGPDDREQQALRFGPLGGWPSVTMDLRESQFAIGRNTVAVQVEGVPARTTMENCLVVGVATEVPEIGGKLAAAAEAVAEMRIRRRTPAMEERIGNGIIAEIPGTGRFVFDMTSIPSSNRRAALKYWTVALPLLRRDGQIASPAAFDRIKASLHRLNWAVRTVAMTEAGIAQRIASGTEVPGETPRFPILGSVTGRREPVADIREILAGRFAPASVASMARARSEMRITSEDEDRAHSLGIDPAVIAALGAARGQRIAEMAVRFLADEVQLAAYGNVFGALAAPQSPSLPNIGLLVSTDKEFDNLVTGNAFAGVDIAIALQGGGQRVPRGDLTTPSTTTVRDNRITRPIRTGVIEPGFGDMVPNYSITLLGLGNITVENNTIQQTPYEGMPENIQDVILDPQQDKASTCFAAIGLQGVCGPAIRVIGNAGHNYRHAVLLDCQPAHEGQIQPPPFFQPNAWIVKENTVFPTARERMNLAVFPEVGMMGGLIPAVRLLIEHNHPELP